MKTALTTLAAGAVVAGLVYYFRDKEPVASALKRGEDLLANASDMLMEQYGKVTKSAEEAIPQGA